MSSEHSILYVMRHIDIGGHIEIPYKKVGITGAGNATLTSRLQQISNTKSPIKAQCIAAWEHEDASLVESALHTLLEDSRIEGEWFVDLNNTLEERLQPVMELLGAVPILIDGAEDSYTKSVMKRESDTRSAASKSLLAEISESLDQPLRTSTRQHGPTFFSDKTNLTYYVNIRKSGAHLLHIGRSSKVFDRLEEFLQPLDLDLERHPKGYAMISGLNAEAIGEVINFIEGGFSAGES